MMRYKILPAFILLFSLACCTGSKRHSDKIVLATLKGPSSVGMIKMIDSLNKAETSKIEIQILNEPIQVRKMMLDGTAQLAVLPTTMASILYNKGLKYKIAAIPVWGTLHLYGTDTTISRWSDLKGKTVNLMAKGMTPDVLFRYLLEANGLTPGEDVILDYRFPTHIDLANAMAAEQASLGVISEPTASILMQKNSNIKVLIDLNEAWKQVLNIPIAQTALMIEDELLRSRPQLLEDLLKSYSHSTWWVNQYPDSAAILTVKYGILPDIEIVTGSIPRSNLMFERAWQVRESVTAYLKVFYDMDPDIVGNKMPDEEFFYTK